MITGFNPADMYGVDHIRRVLTIFPGVFTGIGEFSIHKEFVSAKVSGETASLTNPALDRILDFAAETGLVVILHNDVDMPFAKDNAEPAYLTADQGAAQAPPQGGDHLGSRRPRPHRPPGSRRRLRPRNAADEAASRLSRRSCPIRTLRHVNFDISWDEVAKYAVASKRIDRAGATMLNEYPDRFLFGTDTVAPGRPAPYFAVFDLWDAVWAQLTPEASLKVRKGNYQRLFDEGRRRVRAWEKANVK